MDKQEKVEALKQAIENFQPRGEFLDPVLEEHKAKVRHRALLLLDHRARSRHELRERLVALELVPDNSIVDEVLDDLTRSKLIDDATFAEEWVRVRHERRGKSRRVLDKELRDKGVAQPLRQAALKQVDDEDEEALARRLAEKKARSIKNIPEDYAERDKMLRRILGVLARRGFSQSMSMRIARAALAQRIEELQD